jgi:hypothetical protein
MNSNKNNNKNNKKLINYDDILPTTVTFNNNIHDNGDKISENASQKFHNVDDEISKELFDIENIGIFNKSKNKLAISNDSESNESSESNDTSESSESNESNDTSESNESNESNKSSRSNSLNTTGESTPNDKINKTNKLKKPIEIKKADNNFFLQELIDNQLKNVHIDNKLSYSDMKRICKNLKKSIFNKDIECALWNGYITNNKNGKQYINFYFKKKKVALHRLLYMNYIGHINTNEYLKLSCKNCGKCCSINHIKIANSKNSDTLDGKIENKKNNKNSSNDKNDKNDKSDRIIIIIKKVDIEI